MPVIMTVRSAIRRLRPIWFPIAPAPGPLIDAFMSRYVALHWGMTEEQEQEFTCSFCGKGPQELRSLFRGPEANICGECVRRLYDMLDEADDAQSLQ